MKRHPIGLILFITIIDSMGISIVYPTLTTIFIDPAYGLFSDTLLSGSREILLGMTFAAYPLCMFFGMNIIGSYADRWGRKLALICCLVGGILGNIITAIGIIILNFPLIIFGRIITGLTAASEPVSQAVITDISTAEDKIKNLNLLAFASSIGFIVGPLLAILLDNKALHPDFGAYTPFLAIAILSALGLLLLCYQFVDTYKITPAHKPSNTTLQQTWQLLTAPHISRLALIYFLFISGWNFYFQFLSVYLIKEYAFSKNEIGIFLFFTSLAAAICCLLIVRPLLNWLNGKQALVTAFLLIAGGLTSIIFTHSAWVLWISILPLTLGLELAYITIIVLFSDQVDASHKGKILGMLGSMKSAAWVIAPLFSGMLASIDINLPFFMAIICVLLALWATSSYSSQV